MFHVKHSLWRRWCSGRRRARPPARLGVLTSFGAAPRSPPVPSGPSGALHTRGAWALMCGSTRRLVVRPGPATAHGHRSLALPPPTASPPVIQNAQLASESPVIRGYVERYTFSTQKSRHFPPVSVSRPRAPRPDPGRWRASPCPPDPPAPSTPTAPGVLACGRPYPAATYRHRVRV